MKNFFLSDVVLVMASCVLEHRTVLFRQKICVCDFS